MHLRQIKTGVVCGFFGVLGWIAHVPTSLGQASAQAPSATPSQARSKKTANTTGKPKLVLLIVVDQMRGDYVDKFLHQWTGGLRRLVEEGAWFHDAGYPYAATETCVGHAT